MSVAVVPVHIGKVEGDSTSRSDDLLAVEEPLEIRIGNQSISLTMRTPGSDFELAAGFLFAEGMIRDAAEIRSMSTASDGNSNIVVVEMADEGTQPLVRVQRNFLMTSACGVCGKASLRDLEVNACPVLPPDHLRISPEIIHRLPDRCARHRVFSTAPEACMPRRCSI